MGVGRKNKTYPRSFDRALHSTFTVPIDPRPNCHGLYISYTYTAGCW